MKIYLAGGITGLTEEEAFGWRQKVTKKLKPLGVKCLNPVKSSDFDKFSKNGIFNAGDITCYYKDKFDVRRADIILVYLSKNMASKGTIKELGWATAWNKLIIIVNNIGETHPFIIAEAIQVETIEQAIDLIKEML